MSDFSVSVRPDHFILQSIDIKVKKIDIYSDKESIFKSAAQPKNELKRRHMAIGNHVVWEEYATGIVELFHNRNSTILGSPLKSILTIQDFDEI